MPARCQFYCSLSLRYTMPRMAVVRLTACLFFLALPALDSYLPPFNNVRRHYQHSSSSSLSAPRALPLGLKALYAARENMLSHVSVTLEAPVPTLGCTVEESLAEPGSVFVSCFPPQDCESRARDAGLEVGDVLTSVSSPSSSAPTAVSSTSVSFVKTTISTIMRSGEALTIQAMRGSGVMERHLVALEEEVKARMMEEDRSNQEDVYSAIFADSTGAEDEDEDVDEDFAIAVDEDLSDCVIDYDVDGLIDDLWINCVDPDSPEAEEVKVREGEKMVKVEDDVNDGDQQDGVQELSPDDAYEQWRLGLAPKPVSKTKSPSAASKRPYSPSDTANKSKSGTFIRNPTTGEMERF